MNTQTNTKDPHRIAWRLYKLRKGSMYLAANLAHVTRQLRDIRKWRTRPGANQAVLDQQEALRNAEMGAIGAALVEAGKALVHVASIVDETMPVQQRVDLIGAGRYGAGFPPNAKFIDLIANGLEVPLDRRKRPTSAGPLFMLVAAAYGMVAREKRQEEAWKASEALVEQRVEANLGFVHEAPKTIQ